MEVGNIMKRILVITSHPAMAGAKFVVSDRGLILSPKYAPEITAPAVIGRLKDSPKAIPIKATPIVPMVPQDEPVATEVMEQIKTVAT